MVNPLMTRYAERHQVALIMCATVGERSDVMHKRRENISALLFAHLTERIPHQMTISNPAPCASIPLVLIVPTREVVIVPLHNFFVRFTVTAFSIRKIRTSCHSTRALWFSRHRVSPSKKAFSENCFSEKADCIKKTTR